MPNHTANILTVTGDDEAFEEMKAFVRSVDTNGDETAFSLGAIVPMPNELVGTVSGTHIPEWQKEKSAEMISKYGADNWYDWCNANWGTKWDAYQVYQWEGNKITFHTAWSPPTCVIAILSQRFPTLTFELKYTDEGGGFAAVSTFQNGEEEVAEYEQCDPEWHELYMETRGYDPFDDNDEGD